MLRTRTIENDCRKGKPVYRNDEILKDYVDDGLVLLVDYEGKLLFSKKCPSQVRESGIIGVYKMSVYDIWEDK